MTSPLTPAAARARLAETAATGREPDATDAAAITVLAATAKVHPIFGDTSEMTAEEANAVAADFAVWTD
jgi:hypothetical protein